MSKGTTIPQELTTHSTQNKMAAIFPTAFSNAFSGMKMFEYRLRFSLKFVPKGPINNNPLLAQAISQWCLVYWRIYASLDLNELTIMLRKIIAIPPHGSIIPDPRHLFILRFISNFPPPKRRNMLGQWLKKRPQDRVVYWGPVNTWREIPSERYSFVFGIFRNYFVLYFLIIHQVLTVTICVA